MSPIIYTRHRCDPKKDPEVAAMKRDESEGVLWQCPDCHAYWETEARKSSDGQVLGYLWVCLGRPREQALLREVQAALDDTAPATTPMASPDMVQLALDTYWNHADRVHDESRVFTECVECGTGSYGEYTIMKHALKKVVEAVQAKIEAAYKIQHVKVEE